MASARFLIVLAVACVAGLGPGAQPCQAQVEIESVIPAQLPRGQTTVLNVAFTGRDLVVQAAEIAPSAGVTVSNVKRATDSQGVAWWAVTVAVAGDAAPGKRSLVLVMPTGRTLPAAITIPTHVPVVSDLRVMPGSLTQPTLDVQFAVADQSADLGETPYVWFTTGCGGTPVVGAVRGRVAARGDRRSTVRAAIPNPRTSRDGLAGAGACDLSLRMTDSNGIESNTVKAMVEFRN